MNPSAAKDRHPISQVYSKNRSSVTARSGLRGGADLTVHASLINIDMARIAVCIFALPASALCPTVRSVGIASAHNTVIEGADRA